MTGKATVRKISPDSGVPNQPDANNANPAHAVMRIHTMTAEYQASALICLPVRVRIAKANIGRMSISNTDHSLYHIHDSITAITIAVMIAAHQARTLIALSIITSPVIRLTYQPPYSQHKNAFSRGLE
jgi:hypothetical protein